MDMTDAGGLQAGLAKYEDMLDTVSDPSQKAVFKVSAGGHARDHSRVFLNQDLAAIGPGGPGEWSEENRKNFDPKDQTPLRALAEMREGDLVVMTNGFSVLTVGRVVAKYRFDPRLRLVGGWDLFHYVRVKWADWREEPVKKEFGREPPAQLDLRIRRRACRLGGQSSETIDWARRVDRRLEQLGCWSRELEPLPLDDGGLDPDDVNRCLPESVQRADLWEVVNRAKKMWEEINWAQGPSESEAVALLTVPLLLALGWKPGSIALEWQRIDVALFDGDKNGQNCRLLVEAKRPGSGLSWAKGQAFDYANDERREIPKETPVLVTDGFSIALFQRGADADQDPLGEVFLPEIRKHSLDFFNHLDKICPDA